MKRRAPASLEAFDQRAEAVEVDGTAQQRVEIKGGVVGDAGQMDHRIASRDCACHVRAVAHVTPDLDEPGVGLQMGKDVAVDVEIEHAHFVAGVEQLGHQARADIAGAAGDQHAFEAVCHCPVRCPPSSGRHARSPHL